MGRTSDKGIEQRGWKWMCDNPSETPMTRHYDTPKTTAVPLGANVRRVRSVSASEPDRSRILGLYGKVMDNAQVVPVLRRW
jgi:hypothetical protein